MRTLKFVWRGHSCPRCLQRQTSRLASKSARPSPGMRGFLPLRTICKVAFIVFLASTPLALAQSNDAAAQKHGQSVYAALSKAPTAAQVRKNPFEGSPRKAAAGGKLFEQHCADCHGRKAGGTRRGPSLLRQEVQQATPGTLFWILTNGVVRRGMPVWSKLPEPERWQIVTFLQSLNAHATNPPNVP
jgi:mono/diheme cytochrome c family protein